MTRTAALRCSTMPAQGVGRWTFLVSAVRRQGWGVMLAAAGAITLAAVLGYYLYAARSEAIDSIAVLPFVNVGNGPQHGIPSTGLSDSIINSLSQLPNLKDVISFSSVNASNLGKGDKRRCR